MVLRGLMGVAEGVTFPSMHAMTARWVEPGKRSFFIARTYFGSVFGVIITYPLMGMVTATYGWEAAFYVTSSITLVWFIAFLAFVYDTPDKHPRIR